MSKIFAVTTMILLMGAAHVYPGQNITFAGTKPIQGFLDATPVSGAVHLDVWEVNHGKTLVNYDADMTKLIHMIIVSDDLEDFQHIHPVWQRDGHFTIDMHPRKLGLYHVYIDGIPHDVGREVFRFDIPVKNDAAPPVRQLHADTQSEKAGPYTVSLDTIAVPFGEIATIEVTIKKNGKIANDLHPYLGAMAHGVFIGTKNLAYMHGHGMSDDMLSMASGDCGDSMMLSMTPLVPSDTLTGQFAFEILAPSAQPYDFWLQFVGDKTLYTVPFLVTAR